MDASDKLSHHLWSLRQSMEDLIYALSAQQLFIVAGRVRMLERAANEVQRASDAVGELDPHVKAAAAALAESLGVAADAPLGRLAEASAEPWRTVLSEHRAELERLRNEVEALVKLNKEAAKRAEAATAEAIGRAEGYTQTGTAASAVARPTFDLSA
jgi:hypothetical protein